MKQPMPRSGRRSSLQLTLLAWMLAALAAVWASFVIWGYQTGVHEADELTDGHLAGVATLALNWHVQDDVPLRESTPVQPPPGLHAHDYQESLSVVLWDAGGAVISRTGQAPLPDFDIEQGFATLGAEPSKAWRSYTQWSVDRKAKVTVMVSLAERDSLADDIATQMIEPGFWLLPMIVVALGMAMRRGLRPLNQITQRVQALDLSRDQRVSDASVPRELSPLVGAINTLLDRQQATLERERNLANEIAHELRTPLASIALQAQALESARDGLGGDAAMREAMQRIGQDALHAGHVLDQLLTLARAERGMQEAPLQTVNWAALARDVAAAQAQSAWQRQDVLAVDAPESLPVRGNALLLESALRNLIENAVRHTPMGTQIEVQAGLDDDQGLAWIQICDDGRRDAAPEHVPPADSLHLGHEIVGRVMQAHGGRFEQADAPPGFTTCYRMEMPTAG